MVNFPIKSYGAVYKLNHLPKFLFAPYNYKNNHI